MPKSIKAKAAEFVRRESTLVDLRAALGRTLRDLDHAKAQKAELVDAVRQAAKDAVAALDVPPVPRPKSKQGRGMGETAIIVLSDWQLAKVTPTYSSAVCADRVERLAEKVTALTAIQRADHPVRECRIYLLGDMVEGELVFPGQAHRIDASLFSQVLTAGPHILGGFIRSMAAIFERVHVVGVVGNHGALGGRSRKDYHPESNADAMLYEVTRMLTASERVTWAANTDPGERKWYATDKIGSTRAFLFHGDQVKGGFAGFPWYGFGKKLLAWSRMYDFNLAFSGHFHTPVRGYYGGITHWGSGSTESTNTYAAENLSSAGEPCQWLLFVHPEQGVTAEYLVRLDEKTKGRASAKNERHRGKAARRHPTLGRHRPNARRARTVRRAGSSDRQGDGSHLKNAICDTEPDQGLHRVSLPKAVALPFGYRIRVHELNDASMRSQDDGELQDGIFDGSRREIYVRSRLPIRRRRYILSHELGHALQDWQHEAFNSGVMKP